MCFSCHFFLSVLWFGSWLSSLCVTLQDREFLENALKSMTVDEVKRLEELSAVLKVRPSHAPARVTHGDAQDEDDSADAVARKEEALDGILDKVDSIDNARGAPRGVRRAADVTRLQICTLSAAWRRSSGC